MDALVVVILIAGAAIAAFCVGQWLGRKAFEAHGRAQVARMMRDPDQMEEQAAFLSEEAKALRDKRETRK